MTSSRLFNYLFTLLFFGMFILLFSDSPAGWVHFIFLFVAIFGGIFLGGDKAFVGALAFGLIGLLVWGMGVGLGWQARRMTQWSTTDGAITRAWFCTLTVNGNTRYSGPCLEYQYSVNEARYEADSADTREFAGYGLWWRIAGIPESYQVDRRVTVYYDPDNPGDSRLNPGLKWKEWVTMLDGALLMALAIATLVVLRHERQSTHGGVVS